MAPLLEIAGLGKTFGDTRVLRDVSLEVEPGQVHALIGANGSGKSTLIKILAGFHDPDSGASIRFNGQELDLPLTEATSKATGMRFIHQDAPLVDNLSVGENLSLEAGYLTGFGGRIRWRAEAKRARKTMAGVGLQIDPRRLVSELSASERMMLCIAREAENEDWGGRLFVLDEPTAALPNEEAERVFALIDRVKSQGAGIIFVSHRLGEVMRLADHITVLRDGTVAARLERGEVEQEGMVVAMFGETADELYEAPPAVVGTKTRLRIDSVRGNVLRGVSCSVAEGEIVGVYGLLGCGKSELGRVVAGVQQPTEGTMEIDGEEVSPSTAADAIGAGVGYVPQNRHEAGIAPSMTIRENLTMTDLKPFTVFGRLSRSRERAGVMPLIDRYGIKPPDPEHRVGQLSGGNQQKVVMAKWLRCDPSVLVADEPTAGVDISSKHDIYRFIREAAEGGAAVLLLSSEAEEIAFASDRAIVLRDGEVIAELSGNALTKEAVQAAAFREVEEPGSRLEPTTTNTRDGASNEH
ncbi:MAG TPA: sugar ABC transporter ATP-binding protein [Solirubrobacterales bacterium]|jgi:ribose transport system ATP-binding protein